MNTFLEEFTSTGSKLPWHRDVVEGLLDNRGVPKVAGIFITDVCQHTCAFCSTANRARDVLAFHKIKTFVGKLVPRGLQAVILSGGGNPILWKDKESGADFNDLVKWLHACGLKIGLITNGMPMKDYPWEVPIPSAMEIMKDGLKPFPRFMGGTRRSWKNVSPETLDMLTWIRVSLSGWDHGEEINVPDIDPDKTALGGSWVYHDQYIDPADRHGKVSRPEDMVSPFSDETKVVWGADRLPDIKCRMQSLVQKHPFTYVRLLPNCYEIDKIAPRCKELEGMAIEIPGAFVQYKPPTPHTVCLLGYSHPVLWPNGGVTPCDSVTLNPQANRSQGGDVYEIARWDTIDELYDRPMHSLIDPMKHCQGCVFGSQNRLLDRIRNGENIQPSGEKPLHVEFI